jgi:HSP20 family molecular chaperone IbpA
MKEGDDHYLVEVEVPSYAKNDLRLTTNNKEVVLTLNRRYQDQLENNGRTSKINKIETLSSRMPTNHFLNAKKITSTYADGVMTYKIAKA